jgi:ABC-2 type transport system permease protein
VITDIFTIIWKEFHEILLMRGSLRSGLLNIGIIVALVGIFLPLQNSADWLNSPVGLVAWSWLPLFLVIGIVTDAFAGERERHTLETLLSSRLPDQAILFGKMGAAVLYGFVIVVVSVLLGAVTININHPTGTLQFFPLTIFLGGLLVSLLATILMSAVGVLVSLHSATVRQAYQKISIAFMILWFVPILALQFLPREVLIPALNNLSSLNLASVVLWVFVFLIVADLALIYAATRQFQRARLILD